MLFMFSNQHPVQKEESIVMGEGGKTTDVEWKIGMKLNKHSVWLKIF